MAKLIDETGKTYGALYVVGPVKEKGRTKWNCLCLCGKYKLVEGKDLRAGKITSCGCHINKSIKWARDLTNNRFGNLVAIKPIPKGLYQKEKVTYKSHNHMIWECKCDCGNVIHVSSENLLSGNTLSCGCQSDYLKTKDNIDFIKDKKYGELTVLQHYFDYDKNKWLCKCQCSCGRITIVDPKSLRSGHTKSCGHQKSFSYAVLEIKKFLEENNLKYYMEYTFEDLKSPSGGYLRFDFAVFNKDKLSFLIEYNGKQHYEPVEFFGGQKQFEKQQLYDSLKIQYCKEKSIPLLIFDYNQSLNDIFSKIKEAL